MGAYIINVPSTVDRVIYTNVDPMNGKTYIASYSVDDLTPYTEPDLEKVKADVWKCAGKIAYMYSEERKKVFGENLIQNIYDIYSASEAIEKIRQYEQEKEEQIHVGDEVATDAGNRATVLYENPDGTQAFVFKSDGTAAWWTKSALRRTGRNFPEIAAVLEKMRGEQDG